MKFTLLSAVVLACTASIGAATNCKTGLLYCGHYLRTIDATQYNPVVAQSGFDGRVGSSTLNNSLFLCSVDSAYPGAITYVGDCGTKKCIVGPLDKNDYCA